MSETHAVPVSAYMLTCNNDVTVERALQSLHWVDEIVVVDSGSTDGTLDIVRRYTDQVTHRDWPGFRDQYQYASEQCSHDWVLFIDADEEISPTLATEMQAELPRNAARPEAERVRGYQCHRRTFFLGRWHLHGGWARDHEIRLYDRRHGRWEGGLHANIKLQGREAEFRHFYYHYTYESISDQIHTLDKYSSTIAQDMQQEGKRVSVWKMVANPIAGFVRDYILRGGFREGMAGFIVAVNCMFYVFWKYAKLWEAQRGFSLFDNENRQP
jgi:glycosyltransferase involved in cell wall biosynthesis